MEVGGGGGGGYRKRPPSFLWYGGSCSSKIVLKVSLIFQNCLIFGLPDNYLLLLLAPEEGLSGNIIFIYIFYFHFYFSLSFFFALPHR